MADKKTMTPEEKALKRPEKRAECKDQEADPGRCGTGICCSGSQGNEP